jgi:hypothetical protein
MIMKKQILNEEFKRMQKLAGIKEITVRNPIPTYDELKIGDKLRATKDHPPYVMSGDVWKVERLGQFGQLNFVQGQGKARTMMGSYHIQRMLDYAAFRYVQE